MKLNITIYLLLIFFILGCKKDTFTTYEIEKSYTVTDSALNKKFIEPIQKSKILELTLKPKNNESVQRFFIMQPKEGEFSMLGKSRKYANPAKVNLGFSTNKFTATIDFTMESLFPSIITDLGEELTRGADYTYAFINETIDGFELEGVQYGDQLLVRIIDPTSAEAKHILNGGILQDYLDQDKIYYSTPFLSFEIDNKPVQLVIDPNNSGVWIYYNNIKTWTNDYAEKWSDGYLPTSSFGLSYSTSSTGDSLLFDKEIKIENQILQGLNWNKERNKLNVLLGAKGKERTIELKGSKIPIYSFFELSTFQNSNHQTADFYFKSANAEQKIIYEIVKRLDIPKSFRFDFQSVINDSFYSEGWSNSLKTKAFALYKKITSLGINTNQLTMDIETGISDYEVMPGLSLPIANGIRNNYKIKYNIGSKVDSFVVSQNILGAKIIITDAVNFDYYSFDNPMALEILKPLASANTLRVWDEFYDFLKAFESTKVQMIFLPALKDNEQMRVQMKNSKTGEAFVGTGFLPALE